MEYPTFSIEGKVAVVTGASMGLGYGIAKAMAHAGAKVAVAARSMDLLQRLVGEIEEEGGIAFPVHMDVANVQSIQEAHVKIQEHFGSVDILVNNAGLGFNHDTVAITEAEWDQTMDVNVKGLFFCCQVFGREMLEEGSGRIINMSSQNGSVAMSRHAVYCASKGAVDQLTRVLGLEWSSKGVNVNGVAPTFIYTPGTAERLDTPDFLNNVLSQLPIGRVGEIKDVAAAVIYLASPASSMLAGTTIMVDGGWTIK